MAYEIKAILSADAGNFTKAFEEGLNSAKRFDKGIADSIKSAGDKASNLGSKLAPVSAVAGVAGAAMLKMGSDFDESMAKVSTIADTTEVPLNQLETQIKDLSQQTGISSSEIAQNVYDAISAGQKTGDAVAFVGDATKLAKAGFAETGDALDVLTTIMNAYGESAGDAQEISDILINTQNKGKVTVGELASVMGKIIPTANSLNVGVDELGAGYAILTANGIKAAEATTYMNSMFNEMGKSGSKADKALREISGKSFKELKAEGKSTGDVLGMLQEHAEASGMSLADMFGSAEAGKAALTLMKDGVDGFNDSVDDMNASAGATQEAFDKLQTPTEKFRKALNKVKEAGMEVGHQMVPALAGVADVISSIAGAFAELSPETKRFIGVAVGVTAALAPVLTIGGKLLGGISGAIGIIGKLGGAATGLGTAMGAASGGVVGLASSVGSVLLGPVGLAIAGVTALGVGAKKLHGHMSGEAIPAVEGFGDAVSESTAQAVEGYLELENQASTALKQLSWSNQEVTAEMRDVVTGNFDQMAESIITKVQEQKDGVLESLQSMFAESSTLSEEEKQHMLEMTQQRYDEQIQATEDGNARIKEIMESATSEKRALTESEKNEINTIQQEMRKNAVSVMSESAAEQTAILEGLKANASSISARQAADIVKKSVEQKEKTIEQANQEYDERLKAAVRLKEEGSEESIKMADKIIEEATRQRDEAVREAEEMHQDVVEEAKQQAKDHVNEVDWETGEILSRWEVLKKDTSTAMGEIKESISTAWSDASKATKEKWKEIKGEVVKRSGELKDEAKERFEELREGVEDKFKGVVKASKKGMERAKSTVAGFVGQFKTVGGNIASGIASGISSGVNKVVTAAQNVARSALNAAKSFLGIHSPSRVARDEVGLPVPAGTAEGIDKGVPLVEDSMKNMVEHMLKNKGTLEEQFKDLELITDDSFDNLAKGGEAAMQELLGIVSGAEMAGMTLEQMSKSFGDSWTAEIHNVINAHTKWDIENQKMVYNVDKMNRELANSYRSLSSEVVEANQKTAEQGLEAFNAMTKVSAEHIKTIREELEVLDVDVEATYNNFKEGGWAAQDSVFELIDKLLMLDDQAKQNALGAKIFGDAWDGEMARLIQSAQGYYGYSETLAVEHLNKIAAKSQEVAATLDGTNKEAAQSIGDLVAKQSVQMTSYLDGLIRKTLETKEQFIATYNTMNGAGGEDVFANLSAGGDFARGVMASLVKDIEEIDDETKRAAIASDMFGGAWKNNMSGMLAEYGSWKSEYDVGSWAVDEAKLTKEATEKIEAEFAKTQKAAKKVKNELGSEETKNSISSMADEYSKGLDNVTKVVDSSLKGIESLFAKHSQNVTKTMVDMMSNVTKNFEQGNKGLMGSVSQGLKSLLGEFDKNMNIIHDKFDHTFFELGDISNMSFKRNIIPDLESNLSRMVQAVDRANINMGNSFDRMFVRAVEASNSMGNILNNMLSNTRQTLEINTHMTNQLKQQAMEINLTLGGKEYRAHVDDITNTQNTSEKLELAYR